MFADLAHDMNEVDIDSKADFIMDVRGDSMVPIYSNGDGDRLISHNKKYADILLSENQDIIVLEKF